jgi:hypothetical protein
MYKPDKSYDKNHYHKVCMDKGVKPDYNLRNETAFRLRGLLSGTSNMSYKRTQKMD